MWLQQIKHRVKTKPSYAFNLSNRNYYDGEKLIPRSQIREWVADADSNVRSKLKSIAEQFLSGSINNAQAELDALDLITKHHSSIAVIANGGREQMDARAWGRSGPVVKEQRTWLAGLFRAHGNEDVTDERLASRLENFADAGSRSYERLFTQYAADNGFTQCVNIQGGSKEPCDECSDLTDAGPMDMSEMVPPGSRECGPGCQCSVDIVGIDDVAA